MDLVIRIEDLAFQNLHPERRPDHGSNLDVDLCVLETVCFAFDSEVGGQPTPPLRGSEPVMSRLERTGDWDKLARTLDPQRFRAAIEREVGQATRRNALLVRTEIRDRIRGRRYSANAALTVAVKGSSTPLVDTALLLQNVTDRVLSPFEAIVGVMRGASAKDGGDLVNLGIVLHEGATVRVTEAMRRFFYAKAMENPDRWRPLRRSTVALTIPGRPFVRDVAEDRAVHTQVEAEWQRAVERSFRA